MKPDLNRYKDRMDKAVVALKDDFSGLRTGRASASLLDQIVVDAYGATMALNACAAVSVPEPRMIAVNVWDRGLVTAVEKAIRTSNLGLNPITDGQTLRVPIPPLTEERRKDLVKIAGKYAETQRIAVRNVRREAMEDLKKAEKASEISEDEEKKGGTDVQGFTDGAIKRIDELLKSKEAEIMQV